MPKHRHPFVPKFLYKPAAGLCALVFALLLTACGGSSSGPPVTYVYWMTVYDETASFVALMRQLRQRSVSYTKIECGLLHNTKIPLIDSLSWPGGYPPRLLYLTFSAADAETVKDLGWYTVVDDKWFKSNDDAFDCGPLPDVG